LELAVGQVEPDRVATLREHPAGALGGAASDLEYGPVRHIPEEVQVALLGALRRPHETGVAEKAPVRLLVLVGVAVPLAAVRALGLGRVGRPPLRPHRVPHGGQHIGLWESCWVTEFGVEMQPLDGGMSGETWLTEYAGERAVVRIYGGGSRRRGPRASEFDAAVLAWLAGLLPVPPVLEV